MNKTLRNPLTYILFLLPTVVMYTLFYLVPVYETLTVGFTIWDGVNEPVFAGFYNYVKALTNDEIFWTALKNNMYFILFSIFVQIPIIVVISFMISEVRKLRGFYKTIVFLPSILSTAVVGVLFSFVVFHPDAGIINLTLKVIGLESWALPWLGDDRTAFLAILITNAWQWTGFYVVLVLAAIFGISREVMEAAEIDGATAYQRMRLITVPLIRPVIMVIILLSMTGAMKALDIVIVMTNGGPFSTTEVMGSHMYHSAYNRSEYGYANAIANLIMIITIGLTIIYNVISKKFGDVENG